MVRFPLDPDRLVATGSVYWRHDELIHGMLSGRALCRLCPVAGAFWRPHSQACPSRPLLSFRRRRAGRAVGVHRRLHRLGRQPTMRGTFCITRPESASATRAQTILAGQRQGVHGSPLRLAQACRDRRACVRPILRGPQYQAPPAPIAPDRRPRRRGSTHA